MRSGNFGPKPPRNLNKLLALCDLINFRIGFCDLWSFGVPGMHVDTHTHHGRLLSGFSAFDARHDARHH